MGPWLVPNGYLTVNVWPMTDFCMHRLDAFPHSKLEAVLSARASPYRLYSIGFRSCQVYALTHSPLLRFRAYCSVLVAATISSQRKHESSRRQALLLTPFALSSRIRCFGAFLPVLACADFASIPSCRIDDIQVGHCPRKCI